MDFQPYQGLVFDCDGVILDSNSVRARAFYNAALPYGEKHAAALREYHILHGGVSRYVKFEILLRDMVGTPVTDTAMQALLLAFTTEARRGLMQCALAPGLRELREATPHARWMLVSGADQQELRDVFAARGIADWFDGGIFGSPADKDAILARELGSGNLQHPALFFGDSRYDHQAARRAGLDFIFLSGWTDMAGWQEYCREQEVLACRDLTQLIE